MKKIMALFLLVCFSFSHLVLAEGFVSNFSVSSSLKGQATLSLEKVPCSCCHHSAMNMPAATMPCCEHAKSCPHCQQSDHLISSQSPECDQNCHCPHISLLNVSFALPMAMPYAVSLTPQATLMLYDSQFTSIASHTEIRPPKQLF